VMRYQGAVSAVPRIVVEELELDGYFLPAGTILILSAAAANHDPAVFEQPRTFDITVPRDTHLTFGGGPHYCLGAALARAELQEAFPLLAAHLPGLVLDGEPVWRPAVGIFGPDSLPIRFTPTAA